MERAANEKDSHGLNDAIPTSVNVVVNVETQLCN